MNTATSTDSGKQRCNEQLPTLTTKLTDMKFRKTLCAVTAAVLALASCDRELPSYDHIHGKPDKEEQEEEPVEMPFVPF